MDSLPLTNKDVAERKKALSSFVKGGIGLMITANVDMIAAFSTAYWATWKSNNTGEYGGYGLWKMWHCGVTKTDDDSIPETVCVERMADFDYPAWYVTTQIFQTVGLAGFLSSAVMLLMYAFLPQWERNRSALSSLVAISYLSGASVLVGIILFAINVADEISTMSVSEWFLSWSFSLACTALVLNQIAASILVTETKRLYRLYREEKAIPAVRKLSDELNKMLLMNAPT